MIARCLLRTVILSPTLGVLRTGLFPPQRFLLPDVARLLTLTPLLFDPPTAVCSVWVHGRCCPVLKAVQANLARAGSSSLSVSLSAARVGALSEGACKVKGETFVEWRTQYRDSFVHQQLSYIAAFPSQLPARRHSTTQKVRNGQRCLHFMSRRGMSGVVSATLSRLARPSETLDSPHLHFICQVPVDRSSRWSSLCS